MLKSVRNSPVCDDHLSVGNVLTTVMDSDGQTDRTRKESLNDRTKVPEGGSFLSPLSTASTASTATSSKGTEPIKSFS